MNNKQKQIFRYIKRDIKELKLNCYLTDFENIVLYKKICDTIINTINITLKYNNEINKKHKKVKR